MKFWVEYEIEESPEYTLGKDEIQFYGITAIAKVEIVSELVTIKLTGMFYSVEQLKEKFANFVNRTFD